MNPADPFYVPAGSLLSPGDLFDTVPYLRVGAPLRVARKPRFSLPKTYKTKGEMREVFDHDHENFEPPLNFSPPGEEVLATAKKARAIFLTWGSEVEDDQRRGNLHKKDWLVAPIFSLSGLENATVIDDRTGQNIRMHQAIMQRRSPRFFPLESLPDEVDQRGHYVDFRKICCIAAAHLHQSPRRWHLARQPLDEFYHHLIWFLTRKKIFLEPMSCPECGTPVDIGITFEGQPLEPDE